MRKSCDEYKLWLERFGLESVRKLAEEGFSDEEIAARSGLELSVYREWIKKNPDFAEAVDLGKSNSDFYVIKALYKKATGFNVGLKKTYKLKRVEYDPETGKKLREFEELATGVDETYVPGDLNAEKFWLKSRQPDRWSEQAERAESEESGQFGVVEIPNADSIGEQGDEEA